MQIRKGRATLEIENMPVYDFLIEGNAHLNKGQTGSLETMLFLSGQPYSDRLVAWRYEREEQFATLTLMKTIAYAMGEHHAYKDIKPIMIRGLAIVTKDILSNLALRYAMAEQGIAVTYQPLFRKNIRQYPQTDIFLKQSNAFST